VSAAVKQRPASEALAKLDQYSPEELARLVEIAEARRRQDEGRELGKINNAARATAHRAQRLEKARALKAAMPYLKVGQLAAEIYQWCLSQCIRKNNRTPYALGTIVNELRAAGFKDEKPQRREGL